MVTVLVRTMSAESSIVALVAKAVFSSFSSDTVVVVGVSKRRWTVVATTTRLLSGGLSPSLGNEVVGEEEAAAEEVAEEVPCPFCGVVIEVADEEGVDLRGTAAAMAVLAVGALLLALTVALLVDQVSSLVRRGHVSKSPTPFLRRVSCRGPASASQRDRSSSSR